MDDVELKREILSILDKFEYLKTYYQDVLRELVKKRKRIGRNIKKRKSDTEKTTNHVTSFLNTIVDEQIKYDLDKYTDISVIFKYTIVMAAMAYYENLMNFYCNNAKNDTLIKLTDIKGEGIERAKIFMTKVLSRQQMFSNKSWDDIITIRDIRNIIVHNAGRINPDNESHKKLKRKIQSTDGVSCKMDIIMIEDDYIINALDTILGFGEGLIDSIS